MQVALSEFLYKNLFYKIIINKSILTSKLKSILLRCRKIQTALPKSPSCSELRNFTLDFSLEL